MTASKSFDSDRDINSSPSRVRFGSYELDLATGRLFERGTQIPLPAQAFVVLRSLLERPGDPISRQTLRELLWPDGVAGDFDNKLNGVLRKLRVALDDDAEHPRYIETLPKRGYRFVGAVAPINNKSHKAAWMKQPVVLVAMLAVLVGVMALTSAMVVGMSDHSPAQVPQLSVLPLINQSGDEDGAALAHGLTFELTHQLAGIDPNALIVLAPRSARQLTIDDNNDAPVLQTEYVLDGFIRSSMDSVHVILRLHRSSSNEILWTRSYDQVVEQTFGLEQEIAQHVASELRVALVTNPGAIRNVPGDAMDAYWRARFLWASDDAVKIRGSLPLFERAIAIAPDFAQAHSGLADSYNALALRGAMSPREGFAKAGVAARAAIRADDELASGHVALALSLYLGDWAWDEAETEIRRALALSPGRAEPYSYLASLRSIQGEHDGAIEASRRAVQFNPLTSAVTADLAWYYYYGGRYQEALEHINAVASSDPHAMGLDLASTLILFEMGNDSLAAQSLRDMVDAFHGEEVASHVDSLARKDGPQVAWRWWLTKIVDATNKQPPTVNYIYAIGTTVLADTAAALASLERAVNARAPWAPFIGVDPAFVSLNTHPKFQHLMERMGLPNIPGSQHSSVSQSRGITR